MKSSGRRAAAPSRSLSGSALKARGRANSQGKVVMVLGTDTVKVRDRVDGRRGSATSPDFKPARATASVTQQDYQRIKASAQALSEDRWAASSASQQATRHDLQERAEARRQELLAVDAAKSSTAGPSTSQAAQAAERRKKEILQQADVAAQGELEEVKVMKKIALYSKVVTIRDQQVEEKRLMTKEAEEEELRQAQSIEVIRKAEVAAAAAEEGLLVEKKKKHSETLRMQIEERRARRLQAEEERALERHAMLRQLEELKEEEAAKALAKAAKTQALFRDVNEANERAKKEREKAVEVERAEDLKISRYIAAVAAREQSREEVRVAAEKHKEEDVARLRALQERSIDRAAQLDELRAKRRAAGGQTPEGLNKPMARQPSCYAKRKFFH
eukprot:GHVT01042760.1.p1 GENE.GHVT01042760.1~~GHVT01042760.1.p1  ORF type:complete len:389 (+),score=137.54 GHVT01042760.1:3133-4299(+)